MCYNTNTSSFRYVLPSLRETGGCSAIAAVPRNAVLRIPVCSLTRGVPRGDLCGSPWLLLPGGQLCFTGGFCGSFGAYRLFRRAV